MKKYTYYKLILKNSKECYEQATGEIISIELPSGNIFELAIECTLDPINRKQWIITDISTGLRAQHVNRAIKTRKQVIEYLSQPEILSSFDKIIKTEWYKGFQEKMDNFIMRGEPQ